MGDALAFAGIAALGLGMVLVVAGVIVPGLFMPGTYILVLGFLVLAAAGVLRSIRGATPDRAPDGRT